jgi:hypothetical protein
MELLLKHEPVIKKMRYSDLYTMRLRLWRYNLGLPPWNSLLHFGLLDLRHSVGLLGRVISSSQGLYLYTNTEQFTYTHTHTNQTSTPCVASERAKALHALDRSATVTGIRWWYGNKKLHTSTTSWYSFAIVVTVFITHVVVSLILTATPLSYSLQDESDVISFEPINK